MQLITEQTPYGQNCRVAHRPSTLTHVPPSYSHQDMQPIKSVCAITLNIIELNAHSTWSHWLSKKCMKRRELRNTISHCTDGKDSEDEVYQQTCGQTEAHINTLMQILNRPNHTDMPFVYLWHCLNMHCLNPCIYLSKHHGNGVPIYFTFTFLLPVLVFGCRPAKRMPQLAAHGYRS